MGVMESLEKRIGLVACLIYFLGLNSFQSPGVEASPAPNPGNNHGDMRSALKFLQDMDSYYGQIARPRFGKRSDGLLMVPNQSGMYVYAGPSGGSIDLSKGKYFAIA